MSYRPVPPVDSEEASEYKAGDEVYYYRSGKAQLFFLSLSRHIFSLVILRYYPNTISIGSWRNGTVKGQGGSSDESPRYLVRSHPFPIDEVPSKTDHFLGYR